MNVQRIWYGVILLGLLSTSVFLGYLHGRRERINEMMVDIDVQAPNLAKQNSLSSIEIRTIFGSQDSATIQTYGQFFFKVVNPYETEVLFILNNIPQSVTKNSSAFSQPIPGSLEIRIATRSVNGLDFEYETIGTIILDDAVNDLRTGRFSTIIETNISFVERISFFPPEGQPPNVFINNDPNLPPNVRSQPSPYFWLDL